MSKNCQIYTPNFMVCKILDEINYRCSDILEKHIIDNSCGDGAFLVEIVKRYIIVARNLEYTDYKIIKGLEENIHGIEIDIHAYNKCISNLNLVLTEFGIDSDVAWDIKNIDALKTKNYDFKMDFVVGNPPYVNVHNLKDVDYKNFEFTKKGSIDLYLIFFEIGIKMLNANGKLAYITPNSFLTSKAGSEFRKFITDNKILKMYIDNEHEIIFDNVQTYTGITLLDKAWSKNKCVYKTLNSKILKTKNIEDFYIDDKFYFKVTKGNEINNILSYKLNSDILVRNGLATNANKIFLNYHKETNFSKKVFKIKKLNSDIVDYGTIIFPYDNDLNLVSINSIKNHNNALYKYLLENKSNLELRKSLEVDAWWSYSRTQGFSALFNNKLVISNIMRTPEQVVLQEIDKDILIYGSGYYIISKSAKYNLRWIKNMMQEKAGTFIEYITLIGKNKGSSYYFFSSDDLNRFISYFIDLDKIDENNDIKSKKHLLANKKSALLS